MKLNLLSLIAIAITINLSITLQLTTPALQFITQPATSHLSAIEESHNEAKSKEYNFLYKPKVDPKTYLAAYGPSPRIMKYLPLLNKEGELNPYNNNTEVVKKKYLAKLKYDKVADQNKVKQLTSFLATEMGKYILTYFQDLARGGLNYYKLTETHFRQWLAIKIIAGKDIKMYARSIAEDIELFKQFYINSRNKKIQQIRGIPQPPKEPMKYVPPTTKLNAPASQLNSIKKVSNKPNQKKSLAVSNAKKPIMDVKTKTRSNMKPVTPLNKINNRQNTLKTQKLNVNVKSNKPIPSLNKGKNNTSKAQKPSPILQANKNGIKNTINMIKGEELNRPKTITLMPPQTNLLPQMDKRQSIYAMEVKNPAPPRQYLSTRTIFPKQLAKPTKTTTNNRVQIIPESKIQVQQLFQDTKFNQK